MDMRRRRELQGKDQQEEAAVQEALEDMERRPQAVTSITQDLSVAVEESSTEPRGANAGLFSRNYGSTASRTGSESVLESQGGSRDGVEACSPQLLGRRRKTAGIKRSWSTVEASQLGRGRSSPKGSSR